MGPIDEILELTRRVEAHIDAGDWVAAGEANGQRHALLTDFFARHPAAELDAETRAALGDVLARNQATVSRLHGERRELAATRRRLDDGASAVRAYQRNAGPGMR